LPAILKGRRPPLYSVTYGGIDAFNALMTTKKAGLSLAEVYRQREEIHRQVIDTVVRTPDAQLVCETHYRRRLRLDTYGHYPKPTEAIRRWRAQRQAGTCVQTSRASPDNARVPCGSRKSSNFLKGPFFWRVVHVSENPECLSEKVDA